MPTCHARMGLSPAPACDCVKCFHALCTWRLQLGWRAVIVRGAAGGAARHRRVQGWAHGVEAQPPWLAGHLHVLDHLFTRIVTALPAPAHAAFSTVGVEQLGAPDGSLIDGRQLTMLVAGGPPEKRGAAEAVVAAVGFIPKYVGPIRYARNLDAIAELW